MNSWVSRHTPKLWTCLREGYTLRHFVGDLSAGLTVAVIALPLAMALGIGSIPQNVADELASPCTPGSRPLRWDSSRRSSQGAHFGAGRITRFRSAARLPRSCRWSFHLRGARVRRLVLATMHGGRHPDPARRLSLRRRHQVRALSRDGGVHRGHRRCHSCLAGQGLLRSDRADAPGRPRDDSRGFRGQTRGLLGGRDT
jgi:hypothetical protein